MNNFEDIQSRWQNQVSLEGTEEGFNQILKRTGQIKNKQKTTNVILGITVAILIAFFFYVEAQLEIMASLGLGLMIIGLIARIIIELFSIKSLREIKHNLDFKSFKQKLQSYYKRRITTHYIATPIILALYITGFLILIPFFKASLSSGFYLYIQVSFVVILLIGTFLIFKEIQKELSVLKTLISE
ncbi:hypothetical protein [Winogradskyella forsetii]|uniref:hypothetical protein n=1 Tax=Winogradskyella forsetii TaxID=2686077 RepID=UPI0015C1250E|nr:hypothetical protein [Winogradskyella forsetii]